MRSGVLRSEQARAEALNSAREAARRSGLSLGEWLDSIVDQAGAGDLARDRSILSDRDDDAIRARLNDIAEQLDKLGAGREKSFSRQATSYEPPDKLSKALDRLTRRLEALLPEERDSPAPAASREPPSSPAPSNAQSDIERAVADIAARQRVLDEPSVATPAASVDLSGLEQQLRHITEQIEALRRPCGVENAVAALRTELAEIYRTINDAMPRRALESLEAEVRALTQRIDAGRDRAADLHAMAGLEHGLQEIRDALRTLTPAESLASVSDLIRALAHKIDGLAAGGADPSALRQVEAAVSKLREVAHGAASGEALSALATEVHAIAAKVDCLLSSDSYGPIGEDLSARIEALAQKLDGRRGEGGLLRLDHLEENINKLVERLEVSGTRSQNFEMIERSLGNLAVQIGEARVSAVEAAERAAKAVAREVAGRAHDGSEFDELKRDLSELRIVQKASDQRTQTTLEAVHGTLEKLVNRLGSLESELREDVRVLAETSREQAVAREHQSRETAEPPKIPISPSAESPAEASALAAMRMREQRPIDPNLPADHPLEPGSVTPRSRHSMERSRPTDQKPLQSGGGADMASEKKGSFIAAARRAAQAAQIETAGQSGPELNLDSDDVASERNIFARHRRPFLIGLGAFLLIVGIGHLILNMLGGRVMPAAPPPAAKDSSAPAIPAPLREGRVPAINAAPETVDSPSVETTGSTTERPGRASGLAPISQSIVSNAPASGFLGSVERGSQGLVQSPAPLSVDSPEKATTGATIPPQAVVGQKYTDLKQTSLSAPGLPAEQLPASIGASALRSAAVRGDAAAEYEIAVRYAEGRGVPQNLEAAARWFERAAGQGLAPAQYRLGSLYEKGQGVKKDVEAARRLYAAASEKGNAKSMHNLAVLFAEGIDGKPDYRSASTWFRRAADRGVADSQYNLGILYARGIGVEQNLAESYKWFALAAAQGDQDAVKKRDDIAQRIDPQSLIAARLAVQTFTPQPQPKEATEANAPGAGERPNAASRSEKSKSTGTRKRGAT